MPDFDRAIPGEIITDLQIYRLQFAANAHPRLPTKSQSHPNSGKPYYFYRQSTLATSLTGAAETSVVVTEAMPTEVSTTGSLRLTMADGSYARIPYYNRAGSVFTIRPTDFTTNNASSGGQIFISSGFATVLAELRGDILAAGSSDHYVSGPWPVSSMETTYGIFGYDQFGKPVGRIESPHVDFYFASSVSAQSVSLHSRGVVSGDPLYENWNGTPEIASFSVKMVVPLAVHFSGRFSIECYTKRPEGISGSTVNTTFPGASFTATLPPPPAVGMAQFLQTPVIDVDVPAGIYRFDVAIQGGGTIFPEVSSLDSDITLSVGSVEVVNGIHNTLPVYRIKASVPIPEPSEPIDSDPYGLLNNKGFGIYGWRKGSTNPITGLRFQSGYYATGKYFSASIAGLWVAKTKMIPGHPELNEWMPWNELSNVSPYVGTPAPGFEIHERRTQPAEGVLVTRANNTAVAAGNYIRQANLYYYAISGGTTASTPPTFGGTGVLDGGVTWISMGNNLPARARMFAMASYPFHKLGDSQVLPYKHWTRFINPSQQPYFWIRKIRLSRMRDITADQKTIGGTLDPIDVDLGCIRNGSFVSFGTYRTNSTYVVLWPIFTQAALVYSCAERIAVSAEMTWIQPIEGSASINYPILADHYNDTVAAMAQLTTQQ